MSGVEYKSRFENIPMTILEINDKKDELFTKLPSEIEENKQGLFSKIKNFFKERFGNKPKMLTSGNVMNRVEVPNKSHLEGIMLTEEQEAAFRRGETQILNSYNNDTYVYGRQSNIKEDGERYS